VRLGLKVIVSTAGTKHTTEICLKLFSTLSTYTCSEPVDCILFLLMSERQWCQLSLVNNAIDKFRCLVY
jgi:hypothetical protein